MAGVGPRDAPLDLGHGADDVHDEAAVARERTPVDPDRGLQGREEGPGRSGEVLLPAMRGVVAASEEDGAVGAREVRRVETRREDERDEEDRRAEGPGAGHCRRLSRIERARRSDAGADTSTTTEQERPLAVGAKGTFVNAAGLATHPRARHGRAQRRITHRAARACVSIAHPPADNRTLRPAVASRPRPAEGCAQISPARHVLVGGRRAATRERGLAPGADGIPRRLQQQRRIGRRRVASNCIQPRRRTSSAQPPGIPRVRPDHPGPASAVRCAHASRA